MNTTGVPQPATAHQAQLRPNSCVAASAAILLRLLGRTATEQALWTRLVSNRAGSALAHVVPLLGPGFRYLKVDTTEPLPVIEWLGEYVGPATPMLVQVFGRPYSTLLTERQLPEGPHGAAPWGTLHVVVLYDHPADDRWLALDPWYRRATQPIELGDDELATCVQGAMVFMG